MTWSSTASNQLSSKRDLGKCWERGRLLSLPISWPCLWSTIVVLRQMSGKLSQKAQKIWLWHMEGSSGALQCCGRGALGCLAFATTLLLGKAPGVMVTGDTVPCLLCFQGKSLKIHHRYSSLPFKKWWSWTRGSWVTCQVCEVPWAVSRMSFSFSVLPFPYPPSLLGREKQY